MTERDQLMGALGSLNTGNTCRGQHIPLGQPPLAQQRQACGLHGDGSRRRRLAAGFLFIGDINHMSLTALIKMCQRHDIQRFLKRKALAGRLSLRLDTAWLLFVPPTLRPGSDPPRNGFKIIKIKPVNTLGYRHRGLAGYSLDPRVLGHAQ